MAKKLILLMLCIPIIIMISLFTTTSTVSLAIDVKVTGVEITGDKFLYVDLDEKIDESLKVDYTVFPTNAKNKNVEFNILPYDDKEQMAELDIKEDGTIIPKSVGRSKVEVITADGGFKDSLSITVVATGLESITATPKKSTIYVGESTNIDVLFNPESSADKTLDYESANLEIAQVKNGIITGINKGETLIVVKSHNNPDIKDEFKITVLNDGIINLPKDEIITSSMTGIINVSIDTDEDYELECKALDKNNNLAKNIKFEIHNKKDSALIAFENLTNQYGEYLVEIAIKTPSITKKVSCKLIFKTDFEISFDDSTFVLKSGEQNALPFVIDLDDTEEIKYEVVLTNEDIVDVINEDMIISNIKLKALKPGITKLILRATLGGVTKECEIDILVKPREVNIKESSNNLDIAKMLVFGDDIINELNLLILEEYDESIWDYLIIESSNSKLKIMQDGTKIKLNSLNIDDIITLDIKVEYNEYEEEKPLASIKIKFVSNAKTVSNYNELIEATKSEKVVVLRDDITDFPSYKDLNIESEASLDTVSTTIKSTYDITYYKNIGKEKDAKVRILIEFKNDLYGNGHIINAHNLTYGVDATGSGRGIFKGPLHFVSASESQNSMASVKGQDNICFAVYENVNIDGVTLKGCNDVSDLTYLNYVGTTVEVLGDNVNITNSRINNGRTVLRVFGDIFDPNKKINVNIANCALSNAREFIIRAGSNRFKDGTDDNISPFIDEKIDLVNKKKNYESDSLSEREKYDEKYINTFLNLTNVGLESSGIFAIGLDSHFAGGLLHDAMSTGLYEQLLYLIKDWHDLAKTSYGVKLTLDETVRIYDWKPLDKVDSSTLIEVSDKFDYAEQLKFDVKELVKTLSQKDGFENILVNYNNADYVHGGIAFFGGGKNYDIVYRTDKYKEINYALSNYAVSLSETGAGVLEAAAGEEKFVFMLSDRTTSNFGPQQQAEILKDPKQAYSFLYK